MNGVINQSADAVAGARTSRARTIEARGNAPLGHEELEEHLREERLRHVAVLERVRSAEPVAVGEQDEGQIFLRHLEDERGVGVFCDAEMPHEALAVVALDEPAKTGRQPNAGWVPRRVERAWIDEQRERAIEPRKVLNGG